MFKSAATKIAHNSTLPALAINQDLRPLQDLITAEKAVILSLQRLATDLSKASESLKSWGLGEGDDLGDILTASTTILTHFTSALSQYAAHGHSMREQLKFIRTREENLDELKRRRRTVNSKADAAEKKLNKMNMENKNFVPQTELLNKLRDEIRSLDFEIMKDEAAIGDFKRSSTRMWVGLKFGGLIECCEKGVIAGEYGKLIVSEIPEDQSQPGLPRPPYLAHSRIGDLVAEAHRCVNEVRLSTVPSNSLPPQQQLPQVPHVSDSPFTSQGGYSPAPYPTQHRMTESYSDDPSRRNLVDLQSPTIPLGRFDSPVEQSPQQHQYSNSLSNAILPSSLSGGRRVDEFGSPIVEPSSGGGGGGRFATFPVKARSGSTSAAEGAGAPYSLLATPPPDRGQSDSFSSSVAQALAATTTTTTTTHEQIPPSKIGRFANEPAPSYEASVDLEQSKPSSGSQQSGGGGVDESNLAYMTEREESQHASRHVHFGAADTVPQQEDPLGTPSRQGQQARLARLLQNEDEEQDNSGNMRNEQLMDADAAREVALELNSPFDDSQQQQQQPAPQTTAAAARASSPSPSSPSSSGGGGVKMTDLERAPTYTEKPISYHNQYGPPVGGAGSSSVSPPQYPQYPLSPPSSSPQQQQQQQPPYTHESHDRGYPRTPYPHQQVPEVMSAEATTPVHLYQPAGMQQSVYPAGGGGYGLREEQEQEQDFYNPYSEHQDIGNTGGGGGGGGTPPSMLLSNLPSSSPLPNVPQTQTQSSPVHGLPSGAYPPYNQPLRQQSPPPPVSPSVSISSPLGENNNGGKPRSPLYERPPNAPYMNKPDSGNRSTSSLGSLTPGGGGGGGKISAAAFKRPSPRLGANTSMSAAGMNSTPFSNNTVSPTSGQDTPPLRISKPRMSQQQQQQQQDLGEGQYDYIGAYLNEGEGGEEVGEGGERRGNVNVNVGAGVGTYYYDGYGGGGGGGGGQGKFTENK